MISQLELKVQIPDDLGIKIGGLDSINPTIRVDGLKCDDLAWWSRF
jgi:hypothetical protein